MGEGFTKLVEPKNRIHNVHDWKITAIKEINARGAGTYVMLQCECGAWKEVITEHYWHPDKVRLVFG